MPQLDGQSVSEAPFRLESIEPASDPSGGDGVWFRYVITQGSNTIVGTRSGSRAEVGAQLEQTIVRLNERFGKQLAKQQRR